MADTTAGAAYRGYQLHLVWDRTLLALDPGTGVANRLAGAFCPSAVADAGGGGVTYACTELGGAAGAGPQPLATFTLNPAGPASGCADVHLVTYGPPDNGSASSGSYTVDANGAQADAYAVIDLPLAVGGGSCAGGVATPTPLASPTGTATVASAPSASSTSNAAAVASATPSASPSASSTATATPVATTTPAPTPTPPSVGGLPQLSPADDAPGTTNDAMIDPSGGAIHSPDGRVQVSFPAGATNQPLDVRITRLDHRPAVGPSPDTPFIGEWIFDAFATAQAMAPVHTFALNPTVTFHFSAPELAGLNPSNLAFWTQDPLSGAWVAIPATVDGVNGTVTAVVSHFSLVGATDTPIVDAAPLLDRHNVDLHMGFATIRVPIEVPPGRGGLTPDLGLSYDSARVDEMRLYSSLSGWTGTGWSLSVGSIQASYGWTGGTRYFLDSSGYGGEMLQDSASTWHLADEQYARISNTVDGSTGYVTSWTVTDKQGRQYVFGGDDAHRRWYNVSAPNPRQYYQWDLASVQDVFGNAIRYSYWQQTCDGVAGSSILVPNHCGNCTIYCYVLSAYPQDIKYNGASGQELTDLHFNFDAPGGISNDMVDHTLGYYPNIVARNDDPYVVVNGACAPGQQQYSPPLVQEIRNLGSIDVQTTNPGADMQLVRRYAMSYATQPFQTLPNTCPPQPFTGTNELTSLSILDRNANAAAPLRTMNFQYNWPASGSLAPTMAYMANSSTITFGYQWPYLTQATNGLGGQVNYTYALQDSGVYTGFHWKRSAVTQEVDNAWNGQTSPAPPEPSMTHTYTYVGPFEQDYPNPSSPTTPDPFNAINRGYTQTTDTDAQNNQTVHSYLATARTTGDTVDGECLDATGTALNPDICTGREYNTLVQDAAGHPWSQATTTYSARRVAIGNVTWPAVNFVYPSQTDTYLKNGATLGTDLRVKNTYDNGMSDTACGQPPPSPPVCFGLLSKVDDLGDAADATHGAEVITNTAYDVNTTAWLFVPKTVQNVDPSGTLLKAINLYYDGATALTPPSPPAKGLLTATSTQLTAAAFGTTYAAYDSFGEAVARSVATFSPPESVPSGSQTIPPNAAAGWVPAGLAYSGTTYDATYQLYPTTQTNALNQATSTAYDYVLGKPTLVTEPNGHATNIQYDTFGRTSKVWDSPDTMSYPTRTYAYSWGSAPNATWVQEKTIAAAGAQPTRTSFSCMDGFGRIIDQRQNFLIDSQGSAHWGSVRTDYDARGLKVVVANAVDGGSTTSCVATPASVGAAPASCPPATGLTGLDRTAHLYDPLGNVTCTAFLSGDGTRAAATTAQYNGLTTISCDEDFNTTKQVRNVAARTQTTYAPIATAASCDFSSGTTGYTATTYQYDRLAQLTGVTDALGNVTTLAHDLAGHKTAMQDPDMGQWSYTYDAAGNLHTQTEARGITTAIVYDPLNRPTAKSYSNGQPPLIYTYDAYPAGDPCTHPAATAKGHLTQSGRGAGVPYSQPCYDVRGDQVANTTYVAGQSYALVQGFDDLGQLTGLIYPDGEQLTYGEDVLGDITSMSSNVNGTLVNSAARAPWGAPASLGLGNTLARTYGYDYRERLTSITTGTVQKLTLGYDAASNVLTTSDSAIADSATYTYDQLNRLKTMSGAGTAEYSYDALGDMTAKQEGTGPNANLTLCYPSSGPTATRPHAATSVYSSGGATCGQGTPWLTLTYDVAGNLNQETQGATQYTYDAEDRLTSRTDGAGRDRYTYDASGTLARRLNADGTSTVYIGGVFEKSFDASGNATCVRKYYAFAGKPVAMSTVYLSGSMSACAAGTSYPLTDHLGSVVGLTNNTGTVIARQQYWPYGATRALSGQSAVSQTDKLFTGQQQESQTDPLGLYDYKARFYSTTTGRFASPDPIVASATDPQNWNAYSYVENNPLVRIDPTGGRWCDTDSCDPASSAPMNDYSSNSGSGCDTACQWVAAWNAFHPGECWGCMPAPPPTWDQVVQGCGDPRACSGILAWGIGTALPTTAVGGGAAIDWGALFAGGLRGLRFAAEISPEVGLAAEVVASAFIDDTSNHTKARVVIGENMDRVKVAAAALNAGYFSEIPNEMERGAHSPLIAVNEAWIRMVMSERRIIFDIGEDPTRPYRSDFYIMERRETAGYPLRVELSGY